MGKSTKKFTALGTLGFLFGPVGFLTTAAGAAYGQHKDSKVEKAKSAERAAEKQKAIEAAREEERKKADMNRRLYRSGTIFTSPTGILSNTTTGTTTSARLK